MAGENKDFFPEIEFRRCVPTCSRSDILPSFLRKLNKVRSVAGVPFVLNSAYRTPTWERAHGRSGFGYHTKGRAVDIRCINSEQRYRIMRACLSYGLSVGVYPTFLHVDDREGPVVFWSE